MRDLWYLWLEKDNEGLRKITPEILRKLVEGLR